jgi:hypothetical protein
LIIRGHEFATKTLNDVLVAKGLVAKEEVLKRIEKVVEERQNP